MIWISVNCFGQRQISPRAEGVHLAAEGYRHRPRPPAAQTSRPYNLWAKCSRSNGTKDSNGGICDEPAYEIFQYYPAITAVIQMNFCFMASNQRTEYNQIAMGTAAATQNAANALKRCARRRRE